MLLQSCFNKVSHILGTSPWFKCLEDLFVKKNNFFTENKKITIQ